MKQPRKNKIEGIKMLIRQKYGNIKSDEIQFKVKPFNKTKKMRLLAKMEA